jgi:hypothetical protein
MCPTNDAAIPKEQQTPGELCPHCGVTLPKKGEMTAVEEVAPRAGVLFTSTESLADFAVTEVLGLVTGHVGHVLTMERIAHEQAIRKMADAARVAGGNCVLGMRLSATEQQ